MHKDCCPEGLHATFYKDGEVRACTKIPEQTHRNTLKLSSPRDPCTT